MTSSTRAVPRLSLLLLAVVLAGATVFVALGATGPTAHAQFPRPATEAELVRGANLVVYDGSMTDVERGLNNILGVVIAVWAWDADAQVGNLWAASLPDLLQGFEQLDHGRAYFVIVSATATWLFPLEADIGEEPPLVVLTISDEVFLPQMGATAGQRARASGSASTSSTPWREDRSA